MGMSEHTLERQGHNHLGPRAARTGGEYKLLVAGCPQTYLTCDAVGPCILQESCALLLELHMPPSGRKPVDQNAVQATPVRYACQAPPNQISVEYYLQQGSTLLYACMSCTLHLSHEFRAHSCLWSYGHPTGHGKGGSAGVLHAHSCTTPSALHAEMGGEQHRVPSPTCHRLTNLACCRRRERARRSGPSTGGLHPPGEGNGRTAGRPQSS